MPKRKAGPIPEYIVQIMASIETHSVLAERFDLTYEQVGRIRRSKMYAHLKPLRKHQP